MMVDRRKPKEVYDEQANKFAEKAPVLLTWEFCGKPFFENALKKEYEKGSELKLLDVGSASGRVVRLHIDNGIPAGNITGVEISPKEVEIARREIPDAKFEVGDITDYKLPKEEFDIVTSYMVWEFLDRVGLRRAFENIHNSLKPGGKFVYATTHPGRFEGKWGVKKEGWFASTGPWDGEFDNYYRTVDTFIKQTEDAGFEIDNVVEIQMPKSAGQKYPDRIKNYKTFGAPSRLAVVSHKP